jgi:hypothetical protein
MSDPDVYPTTASFERTVTEYMRANPPKNDRDARTIQAVYRVMNSNIGEYEHGSVDVEDVFKDVPMPSLLLAYRVVCEDVLQSLIVTLSEELA